MNTKVSQIDLLAALTFFPLIPSVTPKMFKSSFFRKFNTPVSHIVFLPALTAFQLAPAVTPKVFKSFISESWAPKYHKSNS